MNRRLKKLLLLAILIAVGLILFSFESFLPQPIPGGKIGLSQLVTLLALVWFGWRESLLVVTSRVFLGNLMLGSLFNPIFLLSLSGALISLGVMAIVSTHSSRFGWIGISLSGAVAHNLTQLIMAYWIFIKQLEIFWLFPYFMWVSIVSGFFIGIVAHLLALKLDIHEFYQL